LLKEKAREILLANNYSPEVLQEDYQVQLEGEAVKVDVVAFQGKRKIAFHSAEISVEKAIQLCQIFDEVWIIGSSGAFCLTTLKDAIRFNYDKLVDEYIEQAKELRELQHMCKKLGKSKDHKKREVLQIKCGKTVESGFKSFCMENNFEYERAIEMLLMVAGSKDVFEKRLLEMKLSRRPDIAVILK
jgi:hypothetical protein